MISPNLKASRSSNKALQCMIFLICVSFIVFSQISLIKAEMEWDNKEYYDELSTKYTIKDNLGLGGTLATVERPPEIPYKWKIIKEGEGIKQACIILNLTAGQDYDKNFYGGATAYNVRDSNKTMIKDIDIRKKIVDSTEIIEKTECIEEEILKETESDGTPIKNCTKYMTKTTEVVEKYHWEKIDINKGVKAGDSEIIAFFCEPDYNEWGDIVPVFYGRTLTKFTEYQESFNEGLLHYYKLNSTYEDLAGAFYGNQANATKIGSYANFQTGRIGQGFNSTAADATSYLNISDVSSFNNLFNMRNNFTLAYWVWKTVVPTAVQSSIGQGHNTPDGFWRFGGGAGNTESQIGSHLESDGGANRCEWNTATTQAIGRWYFVVFTYNANGSIAVENLKTYLNGTETGNAFTAGCNLADGIDINEGIDTNMGYDVMINGGQFASQIIDEIGFWNRTLTAGEINSLYNNGSGLTAKMVFKSVSVVHNLPANNTNSTDSSTITFSCNSTAVSGAEFSTNWIEVYREEDNSLEGKSYKYITGTTNTTEHTLTLTNNKNYLWACFVNDTDNLLSANTINRSLYVYVPAPTVTLNYPQESLNTTNTSINFNCSASGVGVLNLTLFIDGNSNLTITNSTANQNLSLDTIEILGEGAHNWTCTSSSSTGEGTIALRTFNIDLTAPNIIITSPLNNTRIATRDVPYNISFNATISDNIALASCWYSNGTANTTITCGQNASFGINGGYTTLYFYANDTTGNLRTNKTTVFINTIIEVYNFTNPAIEGENQYFSLNITATEIQIFNGSFHYHGSIYTPVFTINSTFASMASSINIPNVSAPENRLIWWNYTLDGANYSTSIYNHTVYPITLINVTNGSCSTGYSAALCFDFKHENNLTTTDASVNYNIKFGASNSTFKEVYGSINNVWTYCLCINSTLYNNYSMGYGEFAYSKLGYSDRRYYTFTNTKLNNQTDNRTLYLIPSGDATSFKLEVEDTSLNPFIEKYTALLRWYPQLNEYNIVEMGKTDEKGETVIHVEVEDFDYRVGVYEINGSLIKLEDPTRFICLINPCTYTLRISPGDTDYTSLLNIDYTFDYNFTTSVWSFVYSDSSQQTTEMNLTIYKITGTETYPICSDFSTSYAGVLSCNTSMYSGNLKGVVSRSASPEVPFVQKIITTGQTAFRSSYGLWLSLLIGIPIVFIFSIMSPIAAIIGGVVALIPALYFGAINWAILGGIAILAGIVIHFLKRIG